MSIQKDLKILGAQVKNYRLKQQMTIQQFAEMLGFDVRKIDSIEKGNIAKISTLSVLAEKLNFKLKIRLDDN